MKENADILAITALMVMIVFVTAAKQMVLIPAAPVARAAALRAASQWSCFKRVARAKSVISLQEVEQLQQLSKYDFSPQR
jgi:hypothetical protein